MQTALSKKLGVEHAIFGFTPFPAVAAAISRAGGFGVLGAVRSTAPDDLKRDLDWIEAHVDGKPYGLDVVMPAKKVEGVTEADVEAMIPEGHRQYVKDTLAKYGVPELAEGEASGWRITGWMEQVARSQLDVAFDYPIRLLANALGSPPPDVVARAHERGVLVAALAGSARHALKHKAAGIDIVVAQGYEAGGHTGEIASMVLTPEAVDAVAPLPVLAAGGIGSGRQIAAALALGAQGVWLGSLWLTTAESNSGPAVLQAYLEATSADTVRSRCYTGKPARMLRNTWTDAWEDPAGPGPLGMPLQNILTAEANARIARSGRKDLAFAPVGQIVGRMNEVQSVRDVVYGLVEEYIETVERLEGGLKS